MPVLLLLGLLLVAGPVEAGVSAFWRELGGSASGDGISRTAAPRAVFDTSVAVGPDGRPVVVYAEHADAAAGHGAIVVRRWNGTAWETLSGSGGLGQGYMPQVRISPSGAIHVAWLHDDGSTTEIRLRRRAPGRAFEELAGSDSPGGIVGANASVTFPFSLAVGTDERPAVAFVARARTGVVAVGEAPEVVDGTLQVYVRRWNGSAWEFVGSDLGGGGASSAVSFAVEGTAYVHGADTPSLALDPDGQPVVAFVHVTAVGGVTTPNTDVYVSRWNGAAWTPVGPAVPAAAFDPGGQGDAGGVSASVTESIGPSIAIGSDPEGTLALAWQETPGPGNGPYVWIRQWDGRAWVELAGSATGSALSEPGSTNIAPQLAVDLQGRSVVTWQARTSAVPAPQVFVRRWNGADAWEELGFHSATAQGISDAAVGAQPPALALTPPGIATAGAPAVAWLDARDPGSSQVFLRQYVAGTASSVSAAGMLHGVKVAVATPAGAPGQGAVGSVDGAVDCQGVGTCIAEIAQGTPVVLQATPQPGNRFLNWSGGPCSGRTSPVCEFVVTANSTSTALFRGVTAVQVTTGGNGAGTVSGPGIACGADCGQELFTGTSATLTPAPATGSLFRGWSGDVCDGKPTGTCVFTVSGTNRSAVVTGQAVRATFELRKQSLTVTRRTTGRVVSDPLPGNLTLDCGTTGARCTGVFDYGTPVVLRATAAPGFVFVTWSGVTCLAGGATNASCAFLLKANTTAAPTFRPRTLVTVVKGGNGAGTVSAPGISCGADCSQPMFDARLVTFTATPAVGSLFGGWGDACAFRGKNASCAFVPAGDSQTVAATFTLKRYALTVTSRTSGTVVSLDSLPDPIACGARNGDCTATLDHGTVVRLQARPIPGSRFVSWTGCTSVVGTNCSFTLTGNRTVTPTYRDVTTVGLVKTGHGTVTSSPGGLSCGLACATAAFDFVRGTLVKLTPTPPVGWNFTGWSGDCTGLGPCSLNTSGTTISRTVNATFTIQMKTLDVTVVGSGSVTGSGGFACTNASTPCARAYPYGTVESLTPTPAPGFVFTGWSQACTGTAACKPLMTVDRAVTATFKPVFGVTVALQGNAAVSTSTITATGISCRGPGATTSDCAQDYLGGTSVTFSRSAPPTGRTFRWLGDCAVRGANASCTLTIDANKSVRADYSLIRLGLAVNVRGPGTVTGAGGAVNCQTLNCLSVVNFGTPVLLQAAPKPQGEFLGWTGCPTVAGTNCSFTLTANRTVAAAFGPVVTGLTVGAAGADGSVPLARGARRQYSAIATFSDGSTRDVTAQATWTSANTLVATVTRTTGLVTGGSPGTAAIMATYRTAGGSSAEDSIEVVTDAIAAGGVTVACFPYGGGQGAALACLPRGLGFEVECRATATFSGGGTHDVTDQAVWSSTSTTIARPLGLTQFGDDPVVASFRIDGAGTAAIFATVGGVVSSKTTTPGTAWVVQGATLTVASVGVQPPAATVTAGTIVPLTATASFAPLSSGVAGCPVTPAAPPGRDFSLLTRWNTVPEDSPVAGVNVLGEVETFAAGHVDVMWRYQGPLVTSPSFTGTVPITVLP